MVTCGHVSRLMVATLCAVSFAWTPAASSEDEGPPRDVDRWHEALSAAIGGAMVDEPTRSWSLGLCPSAGLAVGPPNWISYQLHGYLSLSDGKSFSLYLGYGYEQGPGADADVVTLGWGGVRSLPANRPQRGLYGKFLRYRQWNDDEHGIHHGLSVGAEHGVGALSMTFEVGAAESARDHWLMTAEIALKVTLPILIPLSRSGSGARDP